MFTEQVLSSQEQALAVYTTAVHMQVKATYAVVKTGGEEGQDGPSPHRELAHTCWKP